MNELVISPDEVTIPGVIVERIDAEYLGPQWPWFEIRVRARRIGGPVCENIFNADMYGLAPEGRAGVVSVIRRGLANLPEVNIAN